MSRVKICRESHGKSNSKTSFIEPDGSLFHGMRVFNSTKQAHRNRKKAISTYQLQPSAHHLQRLFSVFVGFEPPETSKRGNPYDKQHKCCGILIQRINKRADKLRSTAITTIHTQCL
ncbi:hypothetical protein [Methylomonas koyamae]|uniref:hypothetical protein n=1 Tax=Methylomonas koyamae TaxID=702114 RepID=UPI001C7FCCC3|nr:hypothetical protein [Methylomonas koyamae]